jgi:hypothetical protein
MFDKHTDWTQGPCYYVMAYQGCRRVWLAGPYHTATDAEAALPRARRWALLQSGDKNAAGYRYDVYQHSNGETRTILGELLP